LPGDGVVPPAAIALGQASRAWPIFRRHRDRFVGEKNAMAPVVTPRDPAQRAWAIQPPVPSQAPRGQPSDRSRDGRDPRGRRLKQPAVPVQFHLLYAE